jgi:hypothetical protein
MNIKRLSIVLFISVLVIVGFLTGCNQPTDPIPEPWAFEAYGTWYLSDLSLSALLPGETEWDEAPIPDEFIESYLAELYLGEGGYGRFSVDALFDSSGTGVEGREALGDYREISSDPALTWEFSMEEEGTMSFSNLVLGLSLGVDLWDWFDEMMDEMFTLPPEPVVLSSRSVSRSVASDVVPVEWSFDGSVLSLSAVYAPGDAQFRIEADFVASKPGNPIADVYGWWNIVGDTQVPWFMSFTDLYDVVVDGYDGNFIQWRYIDADWDGPEASEVDIDPALSWPVVSYFEAIEDPVYSYEFYVGGTWDTTYRIRFEEGEMVFYNVDLGWDEVTWERYDSANPPGPPVVLSRSLSTMSASSVSTSGRWGQ